jgi:UDP-N-acetylglucosamine:LPS N-acetylglucosamine transferase
MAENGWRATLPSLQVMEQRIGRANIIAKLPIKARQSRIQLLLLSRPNILDLNSSIMGAIFNCLAILIHIKIRAVVAVGGYLFILAVISPHFFNTTQPIFIFILCSKLVRSFKQVFAAELQPSLIATISQHN